MINLPRFAVACSLLFGLGCGSNTPPKEAKIGDSCEGMEAVAAYACDGKKVIFCSSFTKFKFKEQMQCDKDQTCKVGEDGTSATCE